MPPYAENMVLTPCMKQVVYDPVIPAPPPATPSVHPGSMMGLHTASKSPSSPSDIQSCDRSCDGLFGLPPQEGWNASVECSKVTSLMASLSLTPPDTPTELQAVTGAKTPSTLTGPIPVTQCQPGLLPTPSTTRHMAPETKRPPTFRPRVYKGGISIPYPPMFYPSEHQIPHPPMSYPPVQQPSTSAPHSAVSHPKVFHQYVSSPPVPHPSLSHPQLFHPPPERYSDVSHPHLGHPPMSHLAVSYKEVPSSSGSHLMVSDPQLFHPTTPHTLASHPLVSHPPIKSSHHVSYPPLSSPQGFYPPAYHPLQSPPQVSHPPFSQSQVSNPHIFYPPLPSPPVTHPPSSHPSVPNQPHPPLSHPPVSYSQYSHHAESHLTFSGHTPPHQAALLAYESQGAGIPPHDTCISQGRLPSDITQRMELLWQGEFGRMFQTFLPHQWHLLPTGGPPEDSPLYFVPTNLPVKSLPWLTFRDSAKVRFSCDKCGNGWTSMKGRVTSWFCLLPEINTGYVLFKLFGQQCKRCEDGTFEHAMWYPDEVIKVVNNLYQRVGQQFYGFYRPPLRIDRRQGKPKEQHNSKLCQACHDKCCREELMFT